MTINDEILAIANQLANQGKKPTVALIKTKVSQPIPLPHIISVLKTWQHDPKFTEIKKIESAEVSEKNIENDDLTHIINKAIQPLHEEIQSLKQLIKQLIDKH